MRPLSGLEILVGRSAAITRARGNGTPRAARYKVARRMSNWRDIDIRVERRTARRARERERLEPARIPQMIKNKRARTRAFLISRQSRPDCRDERLMRARDR